MGNNCLLNSLMELMEDLEDWEGETESCNDGIGIGEGLCKLCVGSDKFLQGVIFLYGGMARLSSDLATMAACLALVAA